MSSVIFSWCGRMKRNKKVKYKVISIISVLGFILCTVALLYPVVSDRWNRYRDAKLVTNYNEKISDSNKPELEAILEEAVEYNRQLKLQGRDIVTDADYEPDDYYETLLNLTGNSMMGYVEIPKIDVTEPIYHYSHEISLGKGIGHIHGSSLPVGGDSTYTILTGHRGLPNQKFFSDLDQVHVGDKFYIHVLNETLAYQVYNIKTIEPHDVEMLKIQDGKDLITLVTCTPYGVNTHRLLVMGERIEFNTEENVSDGFVTNEEHKEIIDPAIWVFIGFVVFIVLFMIISIILKLISRHRKKSKDKSVVG